VPVRALRKRSVPPAPEQGIFVSSIGPPARKAAPHPVFDPLLLEREKRAVFFKGEGNV
jgi:hypothetical protein